MTVPVYAPYAERLAIRVLAIHVRELTQRLGHIPPAELEPYREIIDEAAAMLYAALLLIEKHQEARERVPSGLVS